MEKIISRKLLVALAVAVAAGGASMAQAAAFTAGDLAVFQADVASSSNTTATVVDVNTTTANQTSPASTAIDGTTSPDELRFSGSAGTTGYLSHTADGTLLTFSGANSTTTSGNSNLLTTRGIGTLDAGGNFTLQTTYTNTSGNQSRSATSLDNSTWYISDQGGIYSNGTTAASPAGNLSSIKPFGGTVYVLSSKTPNLAVSTISAPTSGTLTGLNGLAVDSKAVDFYMVSSGSNGSIFDELYILDQTNATVGAINKFSLVGTTWTANGSFVTNFGGFGLAAALDGTGGVDLYATTGNGSTADNSVIKLDDTAGYNSAINITAADDVTLYTATGTSVIKGIDFAPIAPVPEPASLALLAFGGLALLARRRAN